MYEYFKERRIKMKKKGYIMEESKLIEFLSQFGVKLEVNILENNKYIVDEFVMKKEDFLVNILSKLPKGLSCTGIGSKEFYLSDNENVDLTIQLNTYELELIKEIDFEKFIDISIDTSDEVSISGRTESGDSFLYSGSVDSLNKESILSLLKDNLGEEELPYVSELRIISTQEKDEDVLRNLSGDVVEACECMQD